MTRAYSKGIVHDEGPVLVSAVRLESTFSVQASLDVQHSNVLRHHVRRIVAMGVHSVQLVNSFVSGGAKPGSMNSVLTSESLDKTQQDGVHAIKRSGRGIKGSN